jgi:hypothetical protein
MLSSVEIHISTHQEWCPAQLIDVSAHGAKFHDVDAPPRGTHVRVALPVPCHRLHLTGEVVWRGHPFAAVEFDPLTRAQLVALNAGVLEAEPTDPHEQRGVVLLMIDDPAVQGEIGSELRMHGYRVLARSTPLDAILGVMRGPPLRAAIVSAGGGGSTMLAFLADECPNVRRIVVSRGACSVRLVESLVAEN